MSKKSNKFNNIALFLGALAVPYIYFMTVRPKLVQFEKTLDEKITGISDKELDKMKRKMDQIKIAKSEGAGENKIEKNDKL
jgi:hypothetical protein